MYTADIMRSVDSPRNKQKRSFHIDRLFRLFNKLNQMKNCVNHWISRYMASEPSPLAHFFILNELKWDIAEYD